MKLMSNLLIQKLEANQENDASCLPPFYLSDERISTATLLYLFGEKQKDQKLEANQAKMLKAFSSTVVIVNSCPH